MCLCWGEAEPYSELQTQLETFKLKGIGEIKRPAEQTVSKQTNKNEEIPFCAWTGAVVQIWKVLFSFLSRVLLQPQLLTTPHPPGPNSILHPERPPLTPPQPLHPLEPCTTSSSSSPSPSSCSSSFSSSEPQVLSEWSFSLSHVRDMKLSGHSCLHPLCPHVLDTLFLRSFLQNIGLTQRAGPRPLGGPWRYFRRVVTLFLFFTWFN